MFLRLDKILNALIRYIMRVYRALKENVLNRQECRCRVAISSASQNLRRMSKKNLADRTL